MRHQRFEKGMTVKELKELVKDWPETDNDGKPTEVWLGDDEGTSNVVVDVWPLNLRTKDDGTETADLILEW